MTQATSATTYVVLEGCGWHPQKRPIGLAAAQVLRYDSIFLDPQDEGHWGVTN